MLYVFRVMAEQAEELAQIVRSLVPEDDDGESEESKENTTESRAEEEGEKAESKSD